MSALKTNLSAIMDFPKFQNCNLNPTLIVRGSLSNYVLDKYQPAIHDYFPNYQLSTIRNAGHWLHAENREEFGVHLTQFLIT